MQKLYCLGYLVFLENSTFKLFFFQIYWLLAYILKVIPEARCAH